MKERPILFSGEMVNAILDGRKTMTRRVVKSVPATAIDVTHNNAKDVWFWVREHSHLDGEIKCPYGNVGERIWVREAHRLTNCECSETCRTPQYVYYEADLSGHNSVEFERLRPSIHMPRWASRITLEITGVRVERLNEISEDDAYAEGAFTLDRDSAESRYFPALWDKINGKKHPWASNPWVWVVEFKKI